MFLNSDYWDTLSRTEYAGYSNVSYNPNKTKSFLNNTSKNTHFLSIQPVLMTMIDEYILVHKQRHSNNHDSDLFPMANIITYCWKFLCKRASKVYAYFKDKFSDNKNKGVKHISLVLFCKIRSLFRSNSQLYTFAHENLAEYIYNRSYALFHKTNKSKLDKLKLQIQSLRAQINYVWMPIIRFGCKMNDIDDFIVSPSETLLCWFGRFKLYNKSANKNFTEIDELRDTISELRKERTDLVSPYLKRLKHGAYTAEFAQKVVRAQATTNIPRSNFRDAANEIFSFISPAVHKLGGIPQMPKSPNTLKSWQNIAQHSFIDNAKNEIFSSGRPSTLCCDSVKKSGCLGKKVTPIRASTTFERFHFGITYFSYLSNKHSDAGIYISEKLIKICTTLGVKQLSYCVGDTAGSQVKGWRLFRKSDIEYADWSVFVADLPHALNTAYQLACEVMCGIKTGDGEFKQLFAAWLLCNTKKVVENIDSNIEYMLQFYNYDSYNKTISGARTRFSGFIEATESLLFISVKEFRDQKKSLKADHNKLLLIASTLNQHKTKPHITKKETVQCLLDAYSTRCVHACIYSMYCIGKKCISSTMKF